MRRWLENTKTRRLARGSPSSLTHRSHDLEQSKNRAGATFVAGSEIRGYTWVFLMPRGSEPGLAVASAWLLLAIGKRWQSEPSWIDRLGRFMGFYWIVMIAVAQLADQH